MVSYEREISISSDPGWREQSEAIIGVKNFLSKLDIRPPPTFGSKFKTYVQATKATQILLHKTTITVKNKFFHSKSGVQYLQRMIQFYL